MIKKCIVKYDELEKPIELVELKDFNDPKELKAFKEKCDANKVAYLKRLEEKAENERLYRQSIADKLNSLENEISLLKSVISHILGYAELSDEELSDILGIEIVSEPEKVEEPVEEPAESEEPTEEEPEEVE